MSNNDTDEKIAVGTAVLRHLRAAGRIPPPPYTVAAFAEVCGVSPATIVRIERTGRAKVCAELLRRGDLTAAEARRVSRALSTLTA